MEEEIYALIRVMPRLDNYCIMANKALEETALDMRRGDRQTGG